MSHLATGNHSTPVAAETTPANLASSGAKKRKKKTKKRHVDARLLDPDAEYPSSRVIKQAPNGDVIVESLEDEQRIHDNLSATLWDNLSIEEQEELKKFWESLDEPEKVKLVRIDKPLILDLFRTFSNNQSAQGHHHTTLGPLAGPVPPRCTCNSCGRRSSIIEAELEMLYGNYFDDIIDFIHEVRDIKDLNALPGLLFGGFHMLEEEHRVKRTRARQENEPAEPERIGEIRAEGEDEAEEYAAGAAESGKAESISLVPSKSEGMFGAMTAPNGEHSLAASERSHSGAEPSEEHLPVRGELPQKAHFDVSVLDSAAPTASFEAEIPLPHNGLSSHSDLPSPPSPPPSPRAVAGLLEKFRQQNPGADWARCNQLLQRIQDSGDYGGKKGAFLRNLSRFITAGVNDITQEKMRLPDSFANGVSKVADDFLNNEGRLFVEMVEALTGSRSERAELLRSLRSLEDRDLQPANPLEAEAGASENQPHPDDPSASWRLNELNDLRNRLEDEYDYDTYEDPEYDDQEYDEEVSDTESEISEQEKMQEIRRLFLIQVIKLFQERLKGAYKEKLSQDRTKTLIAELEAEENAKREKELKKLKQKEKAKEKKRLQQLAKDEERKRKEEAERAREEEARLKQEQLRAEQKRKKDEARQKKEEEKRKRIEELQMKKDAERRKQEEKERKEREKREREEREKRELKARELKESELSDETKRVGGAPKTDVPQSADEAASKPLTKEQQAPQLSFQHPQAQHPTPNSFPFESTLPHPDLQAPLQGLELLSLSQMPVQLSHPTPPLSHASTHSQPVSQADQNQPFREMDMRQAPQRLMSGTRLLWSQPASANFSPFAEGVWGSRQSSIWGNGGSGSIWGSLAGVGNVGNVGSVGNDLALSMNGVHEDTTIPVSAEGMGQNLPGHKPVGPNSIAQNSIGQSPLFPMLNPTVHNSLGLMSQSSLAQSPIAQTPLTQTPLTHGGLGSSHVSQGAMSANVAPMSPLNHNAAINSPLSSMKMNPMNPQMGPAPASQMLLNLPPNHPLSLLQNLTQKLPHHTPGQLAPAQIANSSPTLNNLALAARPYLGLDAEAIRSAAYQAFTLLQNANRLEYGLAPAVQLYQTAAMALSADVNYSQFLGLCRDDGESTYRFDYVYDDFGAVSHIKASLRSSLWN